MPYSTLIEYIQNIVGNVWVVRLIISTITVLVGLIILYIIKKILFKIKETRRADVRSIENLYSLIKGAFGIILLFLVLYIMTQQQVIVYFILGVALILIAAGWEILANIGAYYVLLLTQRFTIGDRIVFSDIEGEIESITSVFTFIRSEDGLYAVPNLRLLREAARIPKEFTYAELEIRIWGVDDPETASNLKNRIEEEISSLSRSLVIHPKHYQPESRIIEITSDSITLRVKLPVPGPKPNSKKLSRLAEDLAVLLKETGYSFSVSIVE